jgi:transcriptional regulator of arginine metabolism
LEYLYKNNIKYPFLCKKYSNFVAKFNNYTLMKNKQKRIQLITEILRTSVVGSQEELLSLMVQNDCEITQATLSRDLKLMKVSKTPLSDGTYKYVLPTFNKSLPSHGSFMALLSGGSALSIEFSGIFGVVKTKPGYANAIAWDIDNKAYDKVLGTIAGDDTILIIPKEGVTREEIVEILNLSFSNNQ